MEAKPRAYRSTALVYVLLLLGAAYLAMLTLQQSRLAAAVTALAGDAAQAESRLRDYGAAAFDHLSTAMVHGEATPFRLRAGQALLDGLLRDIEGHMGRHPADEPETPTPAAEGQAKALGAALGLAGRSPRCTDEKLSRIAAYLDERTLSAVDWQKRLSGRTRTDNVSRALRDEAPQVRQVAAAVVSVIGPGNAMDRSRLQSYRGMEEALAQALSEDAAGRQRARSALLTIDQFVLPPLIGALAETACPAGAKQFLLDVAVRIVAKEFTYNTRAEVTLLLGVRASRLGVGLVLRDEGELGRKVLALLASSPKVSEAQVRGLCEQLGGEPDGEAQIVRALTRMEGK